MEGATSALLPSDGQMERTVWLLDPKVTHLACLSGVIKECEAKEDGSRTNRKKRREKKHGSVFSSSWEGRVT